MIFSSDGRADASASWRPFCRAYRAERASTPSPEASQKVSPDRSTVTGAGRPSMTSLR
jgi:hypothetical protein